jgi:hypothetical protein
MSEDLEAMVGRAAQMFWHGPDYPKARPLFQIAVERDPDHLVAQWFLFQCELIDGDVKAARERGEILVRLSPNSPSMLLSLVRGLVANGELDMARAAVAQQLTRAEIAIDRRNAGPDHFMEAVLFETVGEKEQSVAVSRAICREGDVTLIDWSTTQDEAALRSALKHMRAKVRHRDICIFGRGPSIKDLQGEHHRLRGHDFVPFVMSEFKEVAERVLAGAGKSPGLVCMTSLDVVRSCASDLRTACSSNEFIGLVLPDFIHHQLRDGTADSDLAHDIVADTNRVFTYKCKGEISFPSPHSPLDFPTINTLLHALGAAILLEPRRIFLFGFEGKSTPTGEYYFAENDKASSLGQNWQSRTERWLRWDSFRFNQVTPCFINHLQLLHDVQYPLIYNVCKDSAITCFPRIWLDEYSSLTKADA